MIAPTGSGVSPLAALIGNLDHRPVRRFPFPGTAVEVGVWVLTDEETRLAEERAYAFVTKTCKLPQAHAERIGLYDREQRVQILAVALRRPETPTVPFANMDLARAANEVRRLSSDVQDALFQEYVLHFNDRSPFAHLDATGLDAQVEALIECLGKGEPADALLSPYDTGTLRAIIGRMGVTLARSTKPDSWDSSSPNGGPSTSTDRPAGGADPTAGPSSVSAFSSTAPPPNSGDAAAPQGPSTVIRPPV